MRIGLLLSGLAIVCLSGCEAAGEPPSVPAANPPAVKKTVPEAVKKSAPSIPSPKKPISFPASMKGVAKKGPDGSIVSEHDLPLIIDIEAPEAPPEIRGPSPPIQPH
jgi:hypothetical protein